MMWRRRYLFLCLQLDVRSFLAVQAGEFGRIYYELLFSEAKVQSLAPGTWQIF